LFIASPLKQVGINKDGHKDGLQIHNLPYEKLYFVPLAEENASAYRFYVQRANPMKFE
jgi:hypothetical protein